MNLICRHILPIDALIKQKAEFIKMGRKKKKKEEKEKKKQCFLQLFNQ